MNTISSHLEKQERRCDLILRLMKLEEVIIEHIHKDELAGYHYVIPKEKLDEVLDNVCNISEAISGELELKSESGKALGLVLEEWKTFRKEK